MTSRSADASSSTKERGGAGSSRTEVLIVENDPDSLEALATLLGLEDIDAIVAESGERALHRLTAGARPSAILLDVWMSDMPAAEFLQAKARASEPVAAIPVIALSGDEEALAQLSEAPPGGGLMGTLRKPFDVDALIRLIRTLT